MVAAVVSPVTLPLARRMEPAPIKPIPGIICEAMRVLSAANPAASSSERIVNSAAPKQMSICGAPLELALHSDDSPKRGRQQQAGKIVGEQAGERRLNRKCEHVNHFAQAAAILAPSPQRRAIDGRLRLARSAYDGNRL